LKKYILKQKIMNGNQAKDYNLDQWELLVFLFWTFSKKHIHSIFTNSNSVSKPTADKKTLIHLIMIKIIKLAIHKYLEDIVIGYFHPNDQNPLNSHQNLMILILTTTIQSFLKTNESLIMIIN
jgi:hypothetical protein